MIMKRLYVKPLMLTFFCETVQPMAFSTQTGGESEDDIILGARQRNMWDSDSKNSLWVTDEECVLEEEGFHW